MILSSTSVKLRTNVTRKPRNLRYLYMTSKVKRARACPTCDALYTVTPQTYSRTSPSLRGTNSSFLPERVLYILRPIVFSSYGSLSDLQGFSADWHLRNRTKRNRETL